MARYPIDRFENPEAHKALKYLRLQQGQTRLEVCQKARQKGFSLSEPYYAQCETDPQLTNSPKSARQPSNEKLDAMLAGLNTTKDEFQQILDEQPWIIEAQNSFFENIKQSSSQVISEGNEFEDIPSVLWAEKEEELLFIYRNASFSQRTAILASARKITS